METEVYIGKKRGWFILWQDGGNYFTLAFEYDLLKILFGVEFGDRFFAVNLPFSRFYINWIK